MAQDRWGRRRYRPRHHVLDCGIRIEHFEEADFASIGDFRRPDNVRFADPHGSGAIDTAGACSCCADCRTESSFKSHRPQTDRIRVCSNSVAWRWLSGICQNCVQDRSSAPDRRERVQLRPSQRKHRPCQRVLSERRHLRARLRQKEEMTERGMTARFPHGVALRIRQRPFLRVPRLRHALGRSRRYKTGPATILAIAIVLVVALITSLIARGSGPGGSRSRSKNTYVGGYTKKDGTYVRSHYRNR